MCFIVDAIASLFMSAAEPFWAPYLNLLLEANVSSLPIVNDRGALIDIYARSDIIQLASDSAYSAISFEDATVSDALIFCHQSNNMKTKTARVYVCTRQDSLRTVLETLALPGVRRIIVIEPESKCVEGIVSLVDVVSFLISQ